MAQFLTQTMSRLFLLGVLLSFAVGLNYLNAWTAPLQAPPAGNVPAPLNNGATLQGKSGGLTIGSTLDIGSSLTVGGVPSNGPYLIDMDAATPGAFKGIRFPDGSVQTTATASSAAPTLQFASVAGGAFPSWGQFTAVCPAGYTASSCSPGLNAYVIDITATQCRFGIINTSGPSWVGGIASCLRIQ